MTRLRVFLWPGTGQLTIKTDQVAAAKLTSDLQNAGVEVVTVLARGEWMILLQTPESPRVPGTQALVQQALKLVEVGQVRGIMRVITEEDLSQDISADWARLPVVYLQVYDDALHTLKRWLGLVESETAMKEPLVFATSAHSLRLREAPSSSSEAFSFGPLSPPSPQARITLQRIERPASDPSFPVVTGRKTRWWLVGIILCLTILILSLLIFSSLAASTPSGAAPRQAVGTATFFSSGMIDPTNVSGSNDSVQIDLSLPTPASGRAYYAWLLPDLSQAEEQSVFLGRLILQHGRVHLRYIDPSNRDLLGWTSRFLVTEEGDNTIPDTPSSDRSTWKLYAEFPQKPNPADMMGHYSLLDHLRHLLVEQPDLQKMGLHGGLALWLRQNTQEVQQWATAARGTGVPQNPDLMHRHFIRILDYLDGTPYVRMDLHTGTPLLVDPMAGQIGLLTLDEKAMPPGYIRHVGMHLEGLIESPGATTAQHVLAGQLDQELTVVKADLEQARQDAIKLFRTPLDQLNGPPALSVLNDLVEQCTNAYVGHYNAQTGTRQGGIMYIADQIQHLATFEVLTY